MKLPDDTSAPPRAGTADGLFAKIAEWQGIPLENETGVAEFRVFASSAKDLARVLAGHPAGAARETWPNLRQAFIFGVRPDHAQIVSDFCGVRMPALADLEATSATLRVATDKSSEALAGWEADVQIERPCAVFQTGGPDFTPLMSLDGRPFFARLNCGSLTVFISTIGMCDLDRMAKKGDSILNFVAGLAPAIIFLRQAFGDRCWRNECPMACFIIDDPLLRPRYGFLKFDSLDDCLAERSAAVSLAFIPWNSGRSDPKTVDLFRRSSRRLSISVHGCNHTRAEFGCESGEALLQISTEALARMRSHEQKFKVAFDQVMVFPQGIFSSAALGALKAAGFVGAVNSTAFATDCPQLPLRELLSVAVTNYGDFPLFLRRYPGRTADLALDVFLGKPALLVEHHGYFRGGYSAFSNALGFVNSLVGEIQWQNLDTICRRTALRRDLADGNLEVRFFAPHFSFENSGLGRRVTFRKRERNREDIRAVAVNGQLQPYEFDGEDVVTQVHIGAGQSIHIALEYRVGEYRAVRDNFSHCLHVMARRYASEFRDNVLSQWAG
jgi:hypothetical protein